jgi:hypothetical protein
MEEMTLDMPIRAVKKNTYNAVINQANLNINPENSPIKKMIMPRSHSFKKITKFVPILQPRKSTFVPTPLKLNKENKELNKEKEQLSEDEIEIIDNDSSCSSISSSQMDSSDENTLKEKEKEKEKIKQIKSISIIKNSSYNLLDNIESKDIEEETDYDIYLNENKENIEKINKLRLIRRKLWQIKAKAIINKYKETEEVIHDNFKNNYNIGLDDIEIDDEPNNNFHGSVNVFEFRRNNNIGNNQKPKSIFEVLSVSKGSIKK